MSESFSLQKGLYLCRIFITILNFWTGSLFVFRLSLRYDILEYPSYGELQFRRPKPPAPHSKAGSGKDLAGLYGGGISAGATEEKRGDLSITSFSQADVNAGSLVYVQNGEFMLLFFLSFLQRKFWWGLIVPRHGTIAWGL